MLSDVLISVVRLIFSYRLPNEDRWLAAGVTGEQRFQKSVCPVIDFVFCRIYQIVRRSLFSLFIVAPRSIGEVSAKFRNCVAFKP